MAGVFDLRPWEAGPSPLRQSLVRGLHLETYEPRMLLSADLIPVSGTIDFPGKTDLYTFDLAEERTLLFDALTNDNQLRWSLTGPGGVVVPSTAFTAADGSRGGSILSLGAGTYLVEVDAQGDHQAEYQFRLLNVDNARPITPGAHVGGVLESQGRETSIYRFEAEAGTELFFDAIDRAGGGSGWGAEWSLVDPDGNTLFGPMNFNPGSDPARLTAPVSGTYTLLLEGMIANSTDFTYGFTVEKVVDVAREIGFGTPVFGEVSQAGQLHHLSFSLEADTRLIFDALLHSELTWSLDGPRGAEVTDRQLRASDGASASPVLDLIAGDYVLTVGDASDRQGSYAFVLHDPAAAEAVALAEEVTGRLGDRGAGVAAALVPSSAPGTTGPEDQAFRFTASGPHIAVEDLAGLRSETFTVELWLRPDGPEGETHVLAKTSSASGMDGYGLFINDAGELVFFVNDRTSDATRVAAPITRGEWVHVAASFDGAALRLHLDGALAAETGFDGAVDHATGPLLLGLMAPGAWTGYRLRGDIDELRFWSTAQSSTDIAARYLQRLAGPAPGLALSLGFDHGPEGASTR